MVKVKGLVLAAVLAGLALGSSMVWGQGSEEPIFVIGVTGGIYQDVQRQVFFEPFTKETGIKIVTVANPSMAKVKAMVETRNADVDLAELTGTDPFVLAKRGLLEELDYSVIPKDSLDSIVPTSAIHPNGLGMFVWATGIRYNTKKYSKGQHPRTWPEFWDGSKFPGPRTLPTPAWLISSFEMALLADRVPGETAEVVEPPARSGGDGGVSLVSEGFR